MHHVTTKIIPLIVGALGTVSKDLEIALEALDLPYILESMQTSAVTGSAIILREVLNNFIIS